jgi:hypothetical protein
MVGFQPCRLTLLLRRLLGGWSCFLVAIPSPASLRLVLWLVFPFFSDSCPDLLNSVDAKVPSLQRQIWGGFHCDFVFSALFFFPFCVFCFLFSFVMFVVMLCVLDQRLGGNFRSSWFGFANPFGLVLLTRKGLVV